MWLFIAFKKIKERRIFYITHQILYGTSYLYLINIYKYHWLASFLKKSHEYSNKPCPSMVLHPQILEYLIILHQVIHSFESDISWLLNLLLKFLLFKWLICGNDYLAFYKKWSAKEIMIICKLCIYTNILDIDTITNMKFQCWTYI